MKLSHYFTHCRERGNARPWFAVGPVLVGRTSPDGEGIRLDVFAGVALSVGSHTFAIHRSL